MEHNVFRKDMTFIVFVHSKELGKGVIFRKKIHVYEILVKMGDLVGSLKTSVISFVYVDQAFKELSVRLLLTPVTQIHAKMGVKV